MTDLFPRPRPAAQAFWIALLALSMALHFVSLATGTPWLHYVTKPVPMVCLVALLPIWSPRRDFYRLALAAGFVLSLVGDVFMMLDVFIGGLSAFLVGHICYIAAFSSGGAALRPARLIPFAAVGAIMLSILWPGLGDLRVPVLAYVTVILSMGWRAAARIGKRGELPAAQWAGLFGAVSFIASDSLIAFNKFHAPIPASGYLIMATYWLGQILIARSAARGSDR